MSAGESTVLACRFCDTPLEHVFADLGMTPLANSYLEKGQLLAMEPTYPLTAYVCAKCRLVQLPEFESPEAIFGDYAYFSSYSDTWLEHCRRYCEAMTARLGLDASSQVIEIASNDGYLLKNFHAAGIPVLGIEPAANVARAAEEAGIPTRVEFFGRDCAARLQAEGIQADLLLGNNVFAHVPDLNDFAGGMAPVLAPEGVLTLEFPHLLRLIEESQFDTIYHEHFSYFSFTTARLVLEAHGLEVFDVEELPTHGGSLRVFAQHAGDGRHETRPMVAELLALEDRRGLGRVETYLDFDRRVRRVKRGLLGFLIEAANDGKTVAAYGAAAKGNTLLNFCGVGTDFLEYVADRSPHKQGRWLPGSRLPIVAPEKIFETRPDYVLILPWNLESEIARDLAGVAEWGGKLLVAVPEVRVL